MISIVQSALQHLKAKLVAHVVRDIESDLAAHDAERRAELLRQAEQHEEWGHEQVAGLLRAHAANHDHGEAPKQRTISHKERSR